MSLREAELEAMEAVPATVLVVDDEPRNREVISAFLEADGCRVATAGDGETALRAVPEVRPDAILLDGRLPGVLDGMEVCRRLKADPATAYLPVMVLTGRRGLNERIRGAAAGADEFLAKPFDHIELVTRVRALTRAKRYHDQLLAYSADLEQRVAERSAELADRNAELQRALEHLRQLDRLKSEFIANVSHELRTPLLHVKGYVDLLAEGAMGVPTAKQAEGLGMLQTAVERLERAVDDIMDFNNLNGGRLVLEPVYVSDVCRNAIQSTNGAAEQRHMTISLSAPPDVPRVLADRVALTRVLRHLLDNAVKFGPIGQVIQVTAERCGSRVRLAVRDRGPGLSATDLERIFDAFYQVDGSITRRAGGLGLGLALVKKLVEAHGSQVLVNSEPGRGSTFWFELRAAP
jgi:signal transduction histidine kinase